MKAIKSTATTDPNFEFCSGMLPRVSRTFAPTIRMLPRRLNIPVTIAYLLCRIADTVEDEESLNRQEKREYLLLFADIFKGGGDQAEAKFLNGIQTIPDHSADVYLLKNLDKVYAVYKSFHPEVRQLIGIWVTEMTMGMIKYAQANNRRKWQFMKSMQELDDYTYYVAGTVGHLLTALFAHFSKKITPAIVQRLESFSESFGKGLQLVNIIRDMTRDLRRGQSYIPDEILHKYRLTRRTIFEADNSEQVEKLFNEMIRLAVDHLDRALDYVVTLPKEETRIRLFCLLPLFWAMQTLRLIQANTLDLLKTDSIKISRHVIHVEFLKALILTFSNRLTVRHYKKIRRDLALENWAVS
jgi:farnesyl-diphosphate farnesyltransferase